MKHVTGELHLGRTERIVGREDEFGWKHATFEAGALWPTGKKIEESC